MYTKIFLSTVALTATLSAQNGGQYQRRAVLNGGGNAAQGRCTVEVVVDGAAEIEVRGDNATMRDISGQQPQWRRFECTGAMPANPQNFAFQGVDGRGRQDLVRDPRNGGSAVVRIEDPEGGAGTYKFDLTWGNGDGYPGQDPRGYPAQDPNRGYPGQDPNRGYPNRGVQDPNRDNRDNRYGGRNGQFSRNDAVGVCQDAIRQQASERFRVSDVTFRAVKWDENPGRTDRLVGAFAIRRGYNQEESYRFSCSVNFDNGQVQSAQIEPMDGGPNPGDVGRGVDVNSPGVQACQSAAAQRIRRNGYQRVEFGSIHVEDRPGQSDLVRGDATADGRYGSTSFTFTCAVNLESGSVRSVSVKAR